jgi:putative CocE/NonD family hydrolase
MIHGDPERRLRFAAVCSAIVLVGIVEFARAQSLCIPPGGAAYPGTVTTRDVRLPMSDGTRLSADITFPAGSDGKAAAGRFPVVLTQTPYNKNGISFAAGSLVQHGYVQVVAETRGTGSSEGIWDSFGTREQLDGAELVEWAAAQPWSSGDVVLHGTSYGAINQFFTAAAYERAHPGARTVKALFPIVPMSDAYRDIAVSGGETNVAFIPLWLGLVTGLGLLPPTYVASDPVGAAAVLSAHVGGALAFQVPSLVNAASGGDDNFDGPFYRTRSPIEVIAEVEVPTFIVGGWFDLFQRGEPLLFQKLRENRVETKLVMGPWYHITAGQGLPVDGVPATDELELRWFNEHVCGASDPVLAALADVNYYQVGDGHFHPTSQWPPPEVVYEPRFLFDAATPGQPGSLADSPPAQAAPDTLLALPISGICSRSTAQWTASGQPAPCADDNQTTDLAGLSYEVPVSSDLTLAGPVAARLFVATNGQDGFLTVRLEDVAADGTSTQLSAGWNLISLRALDETKTVTDPVSGLIIRPYHPFTRDSVQPVAAGVINEVWVEIFPTAARVAAGHRLRLSIQPADTPHQAPSLPEFASLLGGVLSIYHDEAHPSLVVLPVLSTGG